MAWWSPVLQNSEPSPSSVSVSMDLGAEAHPGAFDNSTAAAVIEEQSAMLPQGHQATISESARQKNRGGRSSIGPSSSASGQKKTTARQQPAAKLACPFFKHEPSRHSKECGERAFSVYRSVKQHIVRNHGTEVPPIRCSSCNYPCTDKSIDEHEKSCHFYQTGVRTGFGLHKLARLPSLKLLSNEVKGDTDEETWIKTYEVLFPGEPVPSPYCPAKGQEPAHPRATSTKNTSQYVSTASLDLMCDTATATYLSGDSSTSEPHLEPLQRDVGPETLTALNEYTGAQWGGIVSGWPDIGSSENHTWEQTDWTSKVNYNYEAKHPASRHAPHEMNE